MGQGPHMSTHEHRRQAERPMDTVSTPADPLPAPAVVPAQGRVPVPVGGMPSEEPDE
jgi:hypothetical protein